MTSRQLIAFSFAIAIVGASAASPARAQTAFAIVSDAHLSGASVVPPVVTAATGYCTVSLNSTQTGLNIGVHFAGLSGPNTALHIHGPAAAGATGPITLDLGVTGFTTLTVHVTQPVTPTQVAELKAGLWYLDVHSPANAAGEIRGQIQLAPAFLSAQDGAQPISPPSGSTATGLAKFVLDPLSTELGNMFTFSGLSSNATAIHVHGPARPGADGPIVISMGGTFGTAGEYLGFTTVSPSQAADLRKGLWYFDLHTAAFPNGEIRGQIKPADKTTDFDADGRSELGVFRATSGTWYLQNPGTSAFSGMQFGQSGDVVIPADFDGDGKTDRAVWRNGTFYAWLSGSGSLLAQPFGTTGDDPRVSGDYDRDGRADFAVWRQAATPGGQSYLYALLSTNGALLTIPWGTQGDVSQLGDYDGDAKRDAAVYRPTAGAYYVLQSSLGFRAQSFGVFATDDLTPGDYDSDGKTDFAVWRFGGATPGTWYILQSSTGTLRGELFGISTDVAVAADYDGDGKTDLAVARSAGGAFTWYVMQSSTGTLAAFPFGLDTDYLVPFYLVR